MDDLLPPFWGCSFYSSVAYMYVQCELGESVASSQVRLLYTTLWYSLHARHQPLQLNLHPSLPWCPLLAVRRLPVKHPLLSMHPLTSIYCWQCIHWPQSLAGNAPHFFLVFMLLFQNSCLYFSLSNLVSWHGSYSKLKIFSLISTKSFCHATRRRWVCWHQFIALNLFSIIEPCVIIRQSY